MCVWDSKRKTRHREIRFYDNMTNVWNLVTSSFTRKISMSMWENVVGILRVCIGVIELGQEIWMEKGYWSSVMKKSCASQTRSSKNKKKKQTLSADKYQTDTDL